MLECKCLINRLVVVHGRANQKRGKEPVSVRRKETCTSFLWWAGKPKERKGASRRQGGRRSLKSEKFVVLF